MRLKNILTWTLSALVLTMLTFSCTKDAIENTVTDAPELKLLKEKLPEVHDLIDFNSFKEYTVVGEDGTTLISEGYEAKENGQVVGYYLEADERIFYTAITAEAFTRTDLIFDDVITVPRVFDMEKGRKVPNLERNVQVSSLEELGYPSGRNDCANACLAAQRLCNAACLALQQIAYEILDDNVIVGDITVLDATLACIRACGAAAQLCIDICFL